MRRYLKTADSCVHLMAGQSGHSICKAAHISDAGAIYLGELGEPHRITCRECLMIMESCEVHHSSQQPWSARFTKAFFNDTLVNQGYKGGIPLQDIVGLLCEQKAVLTKENIRFRMQLPSLFDGE